MTRWYYEKIYKRALLLNQSIRHFELAQTNRKTSKYRYVLPTYSPIKKSDMCLEEYLKSISE